MAIHYLYPSKISVRGITKIHYFSSSGKNVNKESNFLISDIFSRDRFNYRKEGLGKLKMGTMIGLYFWTIGMWDLGNWNWDTGYERHKHVNRKTHYETMAVGHLKV